MASPSWKLRPGDRQVQQAADRKAAEERKGALLAKLAAKKTEQPHKSTKGESSHLVSQTTSVKPDILATHEPVNERISRPWAKDQGISDGLKFFSRAESNIELRTQPWARDMVSMLLKAADEGGVHLCLAWPVCFDSLIVLHALANFERNFALDMRGMRTLLYPGSYSSRAALQGALVERKQLSDFYRSLRNPANGELIKLHTYSESFVAMLSALNDIRTHHPEVENPSLCEVIPTFIYDPTRHLWASSVHSPIERSLKKVAGLSHRVNIRNLVNTEWCDPKKAPDALMVMHYSARKETWKEGLSSPSLSGEGRPEVLLLDATSSAEQRSYSAVRRIPDFLRYAVDNGYQAAGAVVVTDDPKTFFILRARLNELKLNPKTQVWAAEGDEAVFSTNAVPSDWKPEQRTNANFSVGIVDRDASQIALHFQRLAYEAGNEDNPSHKAAMDACFYILRLSNLPAGYKDLTAEAVEAGGEDFGSQRNAWVPVKLGLQAALQTGVLNSMRAEADKAIAKAEQLIDDWSDATPMATRLLVEVRKYAVDGREGLTIVLPNKKYILLAHRFLQRKLDTQWTIAETRLDWHTLSSVGTELTGDHRGRHFAFVGVNRNVLRLLVTHPDIPHGTTVLISYKQAEITLTTLTSMKEVEAFKPYRGRMGLLAQELERRLKEIPNPLIIGKLGEIKMTFTLEEKDQSDVIAEHDYYKFDLENGGRAYALGKIYKYESDEEPFFRSKPASTIQQGDFIFDMSDALRSKLEIALQLKSDGLGSVIYPERALLELYHDDVKKRCDLLFKSKKRSALAREIHAKMIEIDQRATGCRPGRIYYWLDLKSEGDTRPHAPKDAKFFKIFCRALQISDDNTVTHWNFIRNARRLSQYLGRELSARYAEILFQPASAAIYRKVPQAIIKQLQQEALHCIYRVERVTPPKPRTTS